MNEILLSIVVPVYNTERFIDNTVASILNSTYRNLEIILINNGSTDNSGEKCNLWAKKDCRVVVKHLMPNVGISNARNEGIKICHGEYIAFADSDDLVHPQMYELLLNRALTKGADMVVLRNKEVGEDWIVPQTHHDIDMIPDHIISVEDAYQKVFHEPGNDIIPVWNKIYKTSLIRDSGVQFVSAGWEDMCFNCMVIPRTNRIVHIDNNPDFYYYVIHSDSTYNRGLSDYRASSLKSFFLIEICAYQFELKAYRDVAISCYRNICVFNYIAKKFNKTNIIDKIISEYYPEFSKRFLKRKDITIFTKYFYKLCFYFPQLYMAVNKIKSIIKRK